MQELASTLSHRSLLIILSDLHDPTALRAIRSAAVRHDMIVVQLQDPVELAGAGHGFIRTREAETGRHHLATSKQPWPLQENLATELRKAGVDYLALPIDQPFTTPLRQFLFSRGIGTRSAP